ncbi:30S ribosomal protein S1 [Candidatus Woesebacteria bacterium]|nr:30S ribosomal protein S1 [Candidatus Woesebacteria bacterium]
MASKTANKEPQTMAELLASAKASFKSFSVGQKVTGKVLEKTNKALIVDIGGKSEGVINEKAFAEARSYIDTLKTGDEITASVLITETREGTVILSLREAMYSSSWGKLEKAQKEGQAVAVLAKAVNNSGVNVEVEGMMGFIPHSQLGKEVAKNPQALIGKYFKAVPVEVDKNTNKVSF